MHKNVNSIVAYTLFLASGTTWDDASERKILPLWWRERGFLFWLLSGITLLTGTATEKVRLFLYRTVREL